MVVFRNKKEYSPPISFLIATCRDLNYEILLKIFPVKNTMQLNIIHFVALIMFYIELFSIYLMFIYIKSKGNFSISFDDFIVVGGLEFIYLFMQFNTLPYWVDDDKLKELEKDISFKSSSNNTIEEMLENSVNKEIANIHQNQAADEIAQKATKKVGKSNTITIRMPRDLDLNNKTVILSSKPKQSSKNNEQ